MADNVTLDSMSGGSTVATDDIGGIHYQIVKAALGALDSATLLSGGNGTTDAGTLRVTVSSDSTGVLSVDDNGGALTVDGTVTANAGSGPWPVTDNSGSLTVDIGSTPSIEDANNTTTTPLGISGVFTGTGTETLNYKSITLVIFADQNSATDGVSLQWSPDNTNWNHAATYTYTASTDMSLTASVRARYFRVVYTNGGTGQGAFRLYTFMHPTMVTGNVRPLEYTLTGQESAEVVRSVISAFNGTAYANIDSTAGGNLKVSVQELSDGVDVGNGTVGTETQRVTVASDSTGVLGATQSGTWNINNVSGTVSLPTGAATEATLGGVLTTAAHDAAFGTAGAADAQVRTVQGIASMTPLLVDGSAVTQPVSGTVTANLGATDNAVLDDIAAATSLAGSGFSSIDLDESEEQVNGSATVLTYAYFWNATAAPLWVQLFNATAASVTVGTTAPTFNFPIPANADSDVAGVTIPLPDGGLSFSTALTVAVTTGSGTNAGAPGANEAGCMLVYR